MKREKSAEQRMAELGIVPGEVRLDPKGDKVKALGIGTDYGDEGVSIEILSGDRKGDIDEFSLTSWKNSEIAPTE